MIRVQIAATSAVVRAGLESLIASSPVEIPAGATLTVTIDQAAQMANHPLGRFRISLTDDPRAAEWGRAPFVVVAVAAAATAALVRLVL